MTTLKSTSNVNVSCFVFEIYNVMHHIVLLFLCLQVKLLVEEGGASAVVIDRWGATPLDEAKRVGAAAVAKYLTDCISL